MNEYLRPTEVMDWDHPDVRDLARALAGGAADPTAIAKRSFEWVRDEIRHSGDCKVNQPTCAASEVLRHEAGWCFAKSHLLAALLRANGIPAGLCYQRLVMDSETNRFMLHGLNAILLPEFGWYRIDPRGNKPGVDARFDPPNETLAWPMTLAGGRASSRSTGGSPSVGHRRADGLRHLGRGAGPSSGHLIRGRACRPWRVPRCIC